MAPGTACKEGLRSKSQFPGVWSKEDLSDGSPANTPARNGFGSVAVSSGDGPAQAFQGVAPGTARRCSGRSDLPSTTGGRPPEARGPTALAPSTGAPCRGAMATRWRTHLHEAKGCGHKGVYAERNTTTCNAAISPCVSTGERYRAAALLAVMAEVGAVSYTHLTLPTKRIV